MAAAPQSQRGSWAIGDPAQNAAAFVKETRKRHRSLGSRQYFAYVQALGCAHAHAALMGSLPGADMQVQLQQVANILRTAEAVLAAFAGEPESEDEDGAGSEDGDGQGGADRLSILRRVLRDVQQQKAGGGNVSSSSSSSSTPPAAAAAAPPAFGSTPFPLPMDALFCIVHRLDAPSRARAAAACKRLRWVVQQVTSFAAASPALVGFVEAVQLFQEVGSEWSDGSTENELAQTWPLDGSAVAGADLLAVSGLGELARVMPFMGGLFDILGGGMPGGRDGLMAKMQEYMAGGQAKVADKSRPAPHANSSPLAAFVSSEPVPYTTSAATDGPAAAGTPTTTSSRSGGGSRAPAAAAHGTRSSSSSTAPAPSAAPVDYITSACCNVYDLDSMCATPLHLDGDIMAAGYQCGWKGRDPGFGAVHLEYSPEGDEWTLGAGLDNYKHGLFAFATAVCADADNALVWCAADGGARIKAFKAPENAAPRNNAAACNRGDSNMMQLQYTFCSSFKGAGGKVAGLHVQGTRVLVVKGSGRLCVWDIADLAPAAEQRLTGYEEEGEVPEDEFRGDIGWRDSEDLDLEVTKGVTPNVGLYQLQGPSNAGIGSSIASTCLLPPTSPSSQAIVANYKAGLLVVHDLVTGQALQQYLGHLYDITDMCAAPPGWQQAHLFATSAASGDVKLWDLRSRLGTPAITLGNPRASPLQALALVAASSSGGAGASSSSSSQLGGGMLCFTGGANESVWCFDLRRGRAQALYELSTGNTAVQNLVWHEGSSTLYASCEGMQEDRMGYCDEESMATVAAAWGPGEPPSAAYTGGTAPEELYWPNRAAHAAKHVGRYFNQVGDCMLAYRFSGSANKWVPCSEEPTFRGRGGW